MIRSVSRTTCPLSHTWRTLKVPDWILEGWGPSWHHGSSWYVILDLCTKFQVSRMKYVKNPPSSKPLAHSPTAFEICHHESSWYVIFYSSAKFQLSTMIRSVSRTTCPLSHTWRTLKVPDWILEGWGPSWHHGSSWYVILDLCTKFQVSRMKYVKNPPSSKSIHGGNWWFLTGGLED